MFDVLVYALLRKYIKDSLVGAGALKGASCQIQSITRNEDNNANIVTYKWEDNAGGLHTSQMTVPDGVTPTVEVGEVRTVEYPKPASIDVRTSDTGIILDFKIPRGKPGSEGGGDLSIESLTDVDITNLKTGQILKYDAVTEKWVNADGIEIKALSDINDVEFTDLNDGQTIVWDAENEKWVNKYENVYCPDDLGAKGDGVTVDDDAFLEGNYIYNLTEGKTYRISSNKMKLINGNGVIGNGKMQVFIPESAATYGDSYYDKSTVKPKNALEDSISYFTNINTFNVRTYGRNFHKSGIKHPAEGRYLNIGAIYLNRDAIDRLPNAFTVCIGRSAVFQRKRSINRWKKTIDTLINPEKGIANYGIPWAAGGTETKSFENTAEVVDDHIELVINKSELTTSWDDGVHTEGVAHFWSNEYTYAYGEFDDLIDYWEVWVKEPAASGCLAFAPGIDCRTLNSENTVQAIIDGAKPLTSTPSTFWSTTLDIYETRKVNFGEVIHLLNDNILGETASDIGYSYNLLNLESFSKTNSGLTLSYDSSTDIFTMHRDEQYTTKWIGFDLFSHIVSKLDIMPGEKFRVNMRMVNRPWVYFVTPYINGQSVPIDSQGQRIDNFTRSIVTSSENNITGFNIGTSSNYDVFTDDVQFRIWITAGETYHEYSKYGDPEDGTPLVGDILDTKAKEQIDILKSRVGILLGKTYADYTFVGTQEEWDALTAAEKAKYVFVVINDSEEQIVFGSAAFKDATDVVRPDNHNLVESNAVYSAIANAVSSVFEPHGEITVAELTPSLLITENLGNVYTISDSGVTNEYFLQGANKPISAKDGVAIVKASADTIMFNLTPGIFDLTSLQKKELTQSISGETTVEGALGAVADDISDIQNLIPSGVSDRNILVAENCLLEDTSEEDPVTILTNNISTFHRGTYNITLKTSRWSYGVTLFKWTNDYWSAIIQSSVTDIPIERVMYNVGTLTRQKLVTASDLNGTPISANAILTLASGYVIDDWAVNRLGDRVWGTFVLHNTDGDIPGSQTEVGRFSYALSHSINSVCFCSNNRYGGGAFYTGYLFIDSTGKILLGNPSGTRTGINYAKISIDIRLINLS